MNAAAARRPAAPDPWRRITSRPRCASRELPRAIPPNQLNYQIEHHLFPSMPRPSLRQAQALVRAFCEQHGLPYCQTSLAGSYVQALRHLNTVARS